MFDKLLIANRGEIACRIIRTARRLGVATVAVYSEADREARHVRLADEALLIGPAPVAESYLSIQRIIAAARRSGATAIHPGYGFLSENADFAEACAAAGMVFVGPPPPAIRAMGSKSAAKQLMAQAGVPLTPGYHGDDQDPDRLRTEAARIGYPVLIKAVAGGGGKGMRRVEKDDDFDAALDSCRREAAASFGDDRVLVERYLTRSRHIEFQVFADRQGNCVHLFERDCSTQRRHQKVLEEAPAPGLSETQRQRMGEAAVAAARAVGYVGAGTVEFIVAPDGNFYFMEMNTRLQVEHPVTEMITGQDLVEWQLRVAAGEPLPLAQEALRLRGHAIEARIYAEDASRDFLPATGRLWRLRPPAENDKIRLDTGVDEGDEITPYYDPMLAKLIVHGDDRQAALSRMSQALADFRVAGVTTNIEFLARLVASPAFAAADLDTGLIERQRELLFPAGRQAVPRQALLAAAVGELLGETKGAGQAAGDPHSPWLAGDGWRMNLPAARHLDFLDGEQARRITAHYRPGHWLLELDGERTPARGQGLGDGGYAVELDGQRLRADLVTVDGKYQLFLPGGSWTLRRDDPLRPIAAAGAHDDGFDAPMPGRVVALLVEPGHRVAKGASLLILEAMKMEHTIRAPDAGRVRQFFRAAGEQVAEGDTLLEFEKEPG